MEKNRTKEKVLLNTDSFFSWRGTLKTGIRIVPRNMGTAGTTTIYQAHEKARNKAMGGAPLDPDGVWICTNSDCVNAGAAIEVPWQSASKEVYCTACGRRAKKQGANKPRKPRPSPPLSAAGHGVRQADAKPPEGGEVDRVDDPWGVLDPSHRTNRDDSPTAPPAKSQPPIDHPGPEGFDYPEPEFFLELTFEDRHLARIPLIEGRTTVLGRRRESGVTTITDGVPRGLGREISKRHLAVSLVNETVSVRDMTSSYGTWLNGQKMEPEKVYVLRFGDRLAFCKDIIYGEVVYRDGANHEAAAPHTTDGGRSSPPEQKSGTEAKATDLPSNLL